MKTFKTVLAVILIANGMVTLVNVFEWALNSLGESKTLQAEQIKPAKIERVEQL